MKQHTISVLMRNRPGALSRLTGLFSGRNFNISSLCVAETFDPQISALTVVTNGDPMIIEQITKQLHKLIDVIKVYNANEDNFTQRELVLIRMKSTIATDAKTMGIINLFHGKVVYTGRHTCILEFTGTEFEINTVIESLRPHGILEVARTGKIAVLNPPETIKPKTPKNRYTLELTTGAEPKMEEVIETLQPHGTVIVVEKEAASGPDGQERYVLEISGPTSEPNIAALRDKLRIHYGKVKLRAGKIGTRGKNSKDSATEE